MENFLNKIINGNSLEVLKTIPDNSIDCCITSPPYWGLRDYGHDEQLGNEKHFKDFVNNLCNVFDEVKRVLKPTGTCFVNLGDTFSSDTKGTGGLSDKQLSNKGSRYEAKKFDTDIPNKCLCLVPERFAIEMIDRGWTLRNQIIWHKPNQMPSSAKDRFTVDFEKVFFFVKQPTDYYFEQQLEPYTSPMNRWGGDKLDANGESTWDGGTGQTTYRTRNMRPNEDGKNMRTVWSINTEPSTEAHFATYPQRLVERMLKAGCPEFVCNKCGVPREAIKKPVLTSEIDGEKVVYDKTKPYSIQERDGYIEARELPTLKELKSYLKKWKGNNTVEAIENTMQSQAPHHWFSGESYPSAEDWIKLKEILRFDDELDIQFTTIKYKPSEKCKTKYNTDLTDCGCNEGFSGGIVLDPFFGSGTTGVYARKVNRNFVGIELNPEYVKIAENRLLKELGMFL